MSKSQITLNKNQVLSEVKACNRVLGKNANLPISDSIVVHIENNQISFKGTDGSNYFSSQLDVQTNINEEFAVQRDLLSSTLNAINKEQFTLLKDNEKVYFQATNDKGEMIFNSFLKSISVDGLPEFPKTDLNNHLTIKTSDFKNILEKMFCYSKEAVTQREALKGIAINNINGVLSFISCDGARLSIAKNSNFESNLTDFSLVLVSSLVSEIKKTESEKITLKFPDTKEYIVLSYGNKEITYPLIQQPYPPVDSLFPKKFTRSIKVKVADIKSAIESVSFISDKNNKRFFKLSIDTNVNIVASNPDLGAINTIVENAEINDGKEYGVGLDNGFVKEALNSFKPEDTVIMEFEDTKLTIYKDGNESTYKHLMIGMLHK
jgi:DNA polymerase III beta subunit